MVETRDWRLEIGDWLREVNGFWGGEVSCSVWVGGAIIRGIRKSPRDRFDSDGVS